MTGVGAEDRERAALIALLRHTDLPWSRIACDVLEQGSAVALLDRTVAGHDTLLPQPERAEAMIREAAELMEQWDAIDLELHTLLDDSYPPQLREIRELPPLVFTRGQLQDDRRAVAVVGSRKATARGLAIARTVAEHLAHRQVTVVSGLAAGIDTAAHTAALTAGGRTVAVIGTGITRYYPGENQRLQDQIATHGLVLSQFWPDTPPRKPNFLMRNAVMSGYAAATLVIEAGEHSGARNQARMALQHGRPVVLLRDLLVHDWARTLADRPGVTVVGSPSELFDAVEEILARRAAELAPWEGAPDLAVA